MIVVSIPEFLDLPRITVGPSVIKAKNTDPNTLPNCISFFRWGVRNINWLPAVFALFICLIRLSAGVQFVFVAIAHQFDVYGKTDYWSDLVKSKNQHNRKHTENKMSHRRQHTTIVFCVGCSISKLVWWDLIRPKIK